MIWLKRVIGVILLLLGLVWIGQGLNFLPGSVMSGQAMWAVIGLIVLVVGGYLLWSTVPRRTDSVVR